MGKKKKKKKEKDQLPQSLCGHKLTRQLDILNENVKKLNLKKINWIIITNQTAAKKGQEGRCPTNLKEILLLFCHLSKKLMFLLKLDT